MLKIIFSSKKFIETNQVKICLAYFSSKYMETKVQIEPKELFFYLDKLVRKLKIKNLNRHPIKFELLTILNDKNISPLQADETQSIIKANESFKISLEYQDDRETNYDSIIILTIYDLIDENQQSIEPTTIHVPFQYRFE